MLSGGGGGVCMCMCVCVQDVATVEPYRLAAYGKYATSTLTLLDNIQATSLLDWCSCSTRFVM